MYKRRRRFLTTEERIHNLVLRRRRLADYNARRRAEKMGAAAVHVSRDEIVKRDGEVCHLCGKDTTAHDRTLDHVVPLVRGGEHVPSNIRIAHRRCNSKKGERLLGEINFSEF